MMVFFSVCTVLWLNIPKFWWPVLFTYSGLQLLQVNAGSNMEERNMSIRHIEYMGEAVSGPNPSNRSFLHIT
jgi:hypothetical protein